MQNILTPDGYKPIEDIQVGDKVVAYDVFTGAKIENEVLDKMLWDYSVDEEGNRNVKEFTGKFYRINGKWNLFEEQSVWRNDNVVFHAKDLQIGDVIFDENDQDVTVTSIEETVDSSWWKLHISGDASYISNGLTLHNASRFWVGGTGTWSNADTTKWSATTGGASGSSVPGSADLATFDSGTGGTGTVTLNYSLTVGGISGGSHTGTLDLGSNTVSMASSTSFNYSGTGVRTLNLSSSTVNLVSGALGGWNIATSTNMTLNAGTSTINGAALQNSSFQGGSLTYYNVILGAGGGGCSLTGSNTYKNLTLSPLSTTGRILVDFNSTQTVDGLFTASGTSSTSFGMIVVRGTGTNVYAGITSTISADSVSLSNIVIQGITATGAGTWSGTNVGDGGGCTGITFTSPVTRYWVATSGGNYASTSSWSDTSGGAAGFSVPLPQDTVVFGSNSITTGSSSIIMNHCAYPSLDFSLLLNNPTINFTLTNGSMYFFGDIRIGSNVTSSGTNGFNILGSSTQRLNFQGHTLNTSATNQIAMVGTNLIFTGDFTGVSTGGLQLISGTINGNGYNISIGNYSNTTQNITRALVQGSGQWTLLGSSATIWSCSTITGYTFTKGSKPIICNYSGSTGTRTIAQGSYGGTFGKSSYPDFAITAGSDIISCSVSRVGSLDFTGFSGTLNNETRVVFGDLTLSPTMTLTAGINVTTLGAETGDTQIITTNGKAIDFHVTVGVQATGSGTVSLADNLNLSARTLTLGNGNFISNGKSISLGIVNISGTNTRTLNIANSTLSMTSTGNVWTATTTTNLTLVTTGSTLDITDTSSTGKTFIGGGQTYGMIKMTGDNITVTGSNTFSTLYLNNPGLTNGTKFTNSTTTTVGSIASSGSFGSLCKVGSSSSGSAFTFASGSPQVVAQYISLQDSTASPAGVFYAVSSTNLGNNTNWNFINPRNRNSATRLKATTDRLRATTDRNDATNRQHASITL